MRKLSGKTINSLALCVALAAPLVYLFGALFMSLAGAHGEIVLAEPQYTYEYVETPHFQGEGNYKYVVEEENAKNWMTSCLSAMDNNYSYSVDFIINGVTRKGINAWKSATNLLRVVTTTNTLTTLCTYATSTDTFTSEIALPYEFYFTDYENFGRFVNPFGTLYKETAVPTEAIVNPGANNIYLFSQFFTDTNFLAQSGREVLNGTPLYGFEPIGELVRYTDENMLHLANLSYGPLVIGYTYYCAHVIIVDLIFYIGSFIPRLIKKTINKLEGGLD